MRALKKPHFKPTNGKKKNNMEHAVLTTTPRLDNDPKTAGRLIVLWISLSHTVGSVTVGFLYIFYDILPPFSFVNEIFRKLGIPESLSVSKLNTIYFSSSFNLYNMYLDSLMLLPHISEITSTPLCRKVILISWLFVIGDFFL